jgi:hypothetical protein
VFRTLLPGVTFTFDDISIGLAYSVNAKQCQCLRFVQRNTLNSLDLHKL